MYKKPTRSCRAFTGDGWWRRRCRNPTYLNGSRTTVLRKDCEVSTKPLCLLVLMILLLDIRLPFPLKPELTLNQYYCKKFNPILLIKWFSSMQRKVFRNQTAWNCYYKNAFWKERTCVHTCILVYSICVCVSSFSLVLKITQIDPFKLNNI